MARSLRVALAILVSVAVGASSLAWLPDASTPARAASPSPGAALPASVSAASTRATATAGPASIATLSGGTSLETLLPNYNASLPTNLLSDVDDWQVGTPAVVPATGTVWWPEFPISAGGVPRPVLAPTILFNVTDQQVVGIDTSVTNASAFAYDPVNGLLYAAEPLNDTVEAVNPSTGVPTGVIYHVGRTPMAVLYDSVTNDLFVANSASANVTVVNPAVVGAGSIVWTGIDVESKPFALVDDPADGWVFVANAGAADVSALDSKDLSEPAVEVSLYNGPAGGMAYSESSDNLAVASPGSKNLTIIGAATPAVRTATITVGFGCTSVATVDGGLEFLIENTSGASLVTVDSSSPFTVSTSPIAVGEYPSELTVETSGNVIIWNNGSRTFSVLQSEASSTQGTTATLGPEPTLLVFDPTNEILVVGDAALPGFEQIDPYTGRTVAAPTYLPTAPLAFAYEANATVLYVSFSGGVRAYNLTTDAMVGEEDTFVGAVGPLAFDASSDLLWVGVGVAGFQAFTTPSLALASPSASVPTSSTWPNSVAIDPSNGSVFVVDANTGDVVQFNGSTGAVAGTSVDAGTNVTSLAWDPAAGVVCAAGDTLSEIDPSTMALMLSDFPLAPHTNVGGIVYEPSRQALYISTYYAALPDSGLLTVVNGSSAAAVYAGLAVVSTGFAPDALAVLPAGSLASSGVVLAANAKSGTISVIGAPPELLAAEFEPDAVDEGTSTTLVASGYGGLGSSTFSYAGLPDGCSSTTPGWVDCVPTESGTFTVLVTLTDAWGEAVSLVAPLTVSSPLNVRTVVGSLPSHEVDLGVPVALSVTADGGTGAYSYGWTFGDGGLASGAEVSHTYTKVGEYVVAATVTDEGGGTAVNETVVTVEPIPTVTLAASPGTATDVGLVVDLTADASGGAGAGSGTWQFGDGMTSTDATTSHVWSTAGLYAVNYTFTDALNVRAIADLSVVVHPPLSGTFSVTSTVKDPVVGSPFDYSATLHNGTPGYLVVWSFGDGSSSSGANLSHAYAAPGTYTVTVTATDAAGGVRTEQIDDIVVGGGSSHAAPLFGGGFGPTLALGLIVGAVVAAVALFFAERSRRSGPSGPPSPYVPPARKGRT